MGPIAWLLTLGSGAATVDQAANGGEYTNRLTEFFRGGGVSRSTEAAADVITGESTLDEARSEVAGEWQRAAEESADDPSLLERGLGAAGLDPQSIVNEVMKHGPLGLLGFAIGFWFGGGMDNPIQSVKWGLAAAGLFTGGSIALRPGADSTAAPEELTLDRG